MSKHAVISLTFGVLVLLFVIGFYAFGAWDPPTAIPPGDNEPAPLNVSSNAQTKDGSLAVNVANVAANGFLVPFGNVGIGAASPVKKLEIEGGGFLLENTGGIANTNPLVTMAANGFSSADGTFRFEDLRNPQSSPSFIWNVADNSGTILAYNFQGGGASRLVITQSGNVGIGTSSPTNRLHVNGVMRLEPLFVPPACNQNGMLYVRTTGGPTGALCYCDGGAGAPWQRVAGSGSCN